MILPTKHIKINQSLIGLGAILLNNMGNKGNNLTYLWENVKNDPNIFNYERFILALDMLFILGLITFKDNKIFKVEQ